MEKKTVIRVSSKHNHSLLAGSRQHAVVRIILLASWGNLVLRQTGSLCIAIPIERASVGAIKKIISGRLVKLDVSTLSVGVRGWSTEFEYTVQSTLTTEEDTSPRQAAAKLAETVERNTETEAEI